MENHHAINGKTHYKWPFSIANCKRLPQGKGDTSPIQSALKVMQRIQFILATGGKKWRDKTDSLTLMMKTCL